MNSFDKFVKITMWAEKRYYGKEEARGLVIDRGGVPSKYRHIENLAWKKYITHAAAYK
jgi:hypothetical protein